jgi:hypothetical protein
LPFHHIPASELGFFDDEASARPRNGHDGRREVLKLLSEWSSRSSWLWDCEVSQRQSSGRRPDVREFPLFSICRGIRQVADQTVMAREMYSRCKAYSAGRTCQRRWCI